VTTNQDERDLTLLAAARCFLPPLDAAGLLALTAGMDEAAAERVLDLGRRTADRVVDTELQHILPPAHAESWVTHEVMREYLHAAQRIADAWLAAGQAKIRKGYAR
jgi:hypothetical protein